MNAQFFNQQNMTNNLANINYIYSGEKQNNIDDDSDDIQEVPQKEDIDYLSQFNIRKEKNPFQTRNIRSNSINSNNLRYFNYTNPFHNNVTLNTPTTGIMDIPRSTLPLPQFKRDNFGLGNGFGFEAKPERKLQSRYSSASENKYVFYQRFAGSQDFVIPNITQNNIIPKIHKINDGPADSVRKKRHNNIKQINMNNLNIKKYDANTANTNNTLTGIYLGGNSNQQIINQNQNYYPKDNVNKKYDQRKNRFLNNKTTSNYNYNAINVSKMQGNLPIATINNNYANNNNVVNMNYGNERLTNVGYNYLNQPSNETFLMPENQYKNQINNLEQPIKKEQIKNNIVNNNNNEKYYINPELDKLINQINDNTNRFLENEYKNKNQIKNGYSNNYLDQQGLNQMKGQNINIIPSDSRIVRPEPGLKPPKKYRTSTNTVITHNTFATKNVNMNKLIEKAKNMNTLESERLTLTNDIINDNTTKNIDKQFLNNNIIYNDFDGSGFLKNYNGVSHPGRDVYGITKTNQDTFICKTNINNIKDFNILGVLDGHGPDGHFVSEYVSAIIPDQIAENQEIKNLSTPEEIYQKLKENNYKIINQAFIKADQLLKNMEFNVLESGTTCCLIIHIGKHIICANTGDSRAIVVYDQTDNSNPKCLDYLTSYPLSIDYKPELPEEISRIMLAGGVVEKLKNDFGEGIGPYRVWKKGKDYPGLAMSRSIGDFIGKKIGVIPDPGILEYDLNKSTKYIIACSDGVWEFLNNEAVMNMGKKYYLENDAVEFSHELIDKAYKEWEKNDKIVDDITAVVAFF